MKQKHKLCTERCLGCNYCFAPNRVNYSQKTIICDYTGVTGKLRGCDAGDDCDKFTPRKDKRRTPMLKGSIRLNE